MSLDGPVGAQFVVQTPATVPFGPPKVQNVCLVSDHVGVRQMKRKWGCDTESQGLVAASSHVCEIASSIIRAVVNFRLLCHAVSKC